MDARLHPRQVRAEDVSFRRRDPIALASCAASMHNGIDVLGLVEVRHIPGVQDVVDGLHHLLIDDLRVREQKRGRRQSIAALHQAPLQILLELGHAVALDHLGLEELELAHEGAQPREGLPARAADAEQQGVAARLLQHPADPSNVFTSIHEHHEVHLRAADVVVIVEELLEARLHLLQVRNLAVGALGLAGVHEAAEDEPLLAEHSLGRESKMSVETNIKLFAEPDLVVSSDQPVAIDPDVLVA
mmetsp:Transcript_83972/g.271376  ORF Transcript_83972/g.271376 Transcript_83972/m.271376 type:complete len:245 (+) Transcript_83972:914-1648(+)